MVDATVIIADFEKGAAGSQYPHDPLVQMLKTVLTGPTGMTAEFRSSRRL
ncbi:hypothetical protein AB0N62_37250 [Streptomyces sp. NPDC093982]